MLGSLGAARKRNYTLAILCVAPLLAIAALPLVVGLRAPAPIPIPFATSAQPQGVDFGKIPISFEPNAGQADPSAHFMAHVAGGTLYFTSGEVVLSLSSGMVSKRGQDKGAASSVEQGLSSSSSSQQSVVHMQFVGASSELAMQGREQLPGKVNYFLGSDPSKWHSGLSTYGNVNYIGLYPGVDLTYSGTGGQLKGTYSVAAGSNPSAIRWLYRGAESISVDQGGNLQIAMASNSDGAQTARITERAPVAWQEIADARIPVSVQYSVAENQSISFVLGSYDQSRPLTIDPTLIYSTYLGGNGGDYGTGIAVDASGNAYVTGDTTSDNFPLQNPFQPLKGGGTNDAFVTKFNAAGSALIYSTYLGGSAEDAASSIAIDASGNAYVTGDTNSTDFPLQNPLQPTYAGGGADIFTAKLSPTGSALIYSTYLGGSDYESGTGIAVDGSGNACVTGYTHSTNYPLQNPFQPNPGGNWEAFVTKFNATGSALIYSTYLGGSGGDLGWGIAADALGNAYITGRTGSVDFPLQNPFQPAYAGDASDAFVTKFNASGSALIYSTYLGGGDRDDGRGIAVDGSGNAYVTGNTTSVDFPLQNPFQLVNGGLTDAFVTRFNASGSALIYSSYLGGSDDDYGTGTAVDGSGNAYVTGNTRSTNFPLQDPLQPISGGDLDAYITKFSAAGFAISYSTYLGGSSADSGTGIAVDGSGNAYATGNTNSANFPLQDPLQPTPGGYFEAFIARISDQPITTPTATAVPPTLTNTPILPTITSTPILPSATVIPPTNTPASVTNTPVPPTSTPVPPTNTPGLLTNTPIPPTATTVPTTPTSCAISFEDVPVGSTFYPYIECMACRGIINGYPCGGPGEPCNPNNNPYFRPGNNVTRGQFAKITSNAAGFNEPAGAQQYEDVVPGSTFFDFIWRLSDRVYINGYPCGGAGEPCGPGNLPYFRPNANVTRGQIAKIDANAAGFNETPGAQQYEDVLPGSTFYGFIWRLSDRGLVNGYPCGGIGEPCGPSNLPYFRPSSNATRGQASKIVSNTFFPNCQTRGGIKR